MKNFLGKDGFIWWIGIVENINDPLTLGRCKVRIFGYHSAKSKNEIPTEDLPWATAIHPLNTPNLYGTPKVGYFVFGFFLDADSAQEPAILGYFPGIPKESDSYFSDVPTNFTRNFANVSQKDSIVLDINGAKIEVSNTGDVTITAAGTLTLKDNTNTYTLSSIKTGLDAGLVNPPLSD